MYDIINSTNLYLASYVIRRIRCPNFFFGHKYEKTVTFALFSDFHYKQGMYSTSIADMNAILDCANKANASFILSGGDFCNDFKGSPELMKAFLENKYNMPAYNIYGNHELEAGNSMDFVTPLLTNDKNVVWGTKDGKVGDGSIAYYYVDRDGFRIVCTDNNVVRDGVLYIDMNTTRKCERKGAKNYEQFKIHRICRYALQSRNVFHHGSRPYECH